jgi:hypothetical protein
MWLTGQEVGRHQEPSGTEKLQPKQQVLFNICMQTEYSPSCKANSYWAILRPQEEVPLMVVMTLVNAFLFLPPVRKLFIPQQE